MISICLRRPEFVPRAYQIFRQILEDAAIGLQPAPDVDVWARVIEGVAGLGKETPGAKKRNTDGVTEAEKWRRRAAKLVERWETASGIDRRGKDEIGEQGLKVYRGWFVGIVK